MIKKLTVLEKTVKLLECGHLEAKQKDGRSWLVVRRYNCLNEWFE